MDTTSFMTKTNMIRRSDKNPNGVYCIAMDVGYSSVKVMSSTIAAIFPSFAIPDNDVQTAGQLSDEYIKYKNLLTGEKWLVGRMALEQLSDTDTDMADSSLYKRDRYTDPMFKVISETGLGLACLFDDAGVRLRSRIALETGLPPKYMAKNSYDISALTETLSGRHFFQLTFGNQHPRIFDITIEPKSVHIMPQPMGTLFSVAFDNDHHPLKYAQSYFTKNVMIFDGGFGTLDLYPIKSHVIQACETYSNLGMRRVLEETSNAIRERFAMEISVPAMQKYLRKGSFRWFDRKAVASHTEPLGDILESCSLSVCNEAIDKLLQAYPALYEYDYLIVTGGTGDAWFDRIKERLGGMEALQIVKGSQNDTLPTTFSNVRGYYMYCWQSQAGKGQA